MIENTEKSNWELYESLLSNHDWYYDYSDDHRVWCAGVRASERIKHLREMLSAENPERAENLFKKYCPQN